MMPQPNSTSLSLSDIICPICMEVLLEPVTLPCNHTLCNPCFQMTVEKSSLCCPFCRRRVSTWARYHSRNKTLVNSELWERIQREYPKECQNRANGQDSEDLQKWNLEDLKATRQYDKAVALARRYRKRHNQQKVLMPLYRSLVTSVGPAPGCCGP